jgi:O-acetyl-ADP-ribose deacetylase (regulator of RNase III)
MIQHFIQELYYITHIENIPSILAKGILSHKLVEDQQISYTPIYDQQIVTNRREKTAPNGKSLWDFANLYFQARNPMLYRVIREKKKKSLVILGIRPQILDLPGVFISTGNAASHLSDFFPAQEGLKVIKQMHNIINNEWWKEEDGSKRKIMAECLIPDSIPPEYISSVYVPDNDVAKTLNLPSSSRVAVVPEPRMFFQPHYKSRITQNLSIIDGDMFFSEMQTVTISVNTVGVMGKGLASRTKYQFPDVYVVYQDVCRSKTLQMGKPYLYQRESFEDVFNDTATFPDPMENKWFLLFPTKRHWRENSDINGIEQGLRWIQTHYQSLTITSLALPALGCGLGNLSWRDVGPLMVRYLSQLPIPVAIYLPREEQMQQEWLTPAFLLGQ